jgi:6,7-dimethyl-8-ribityllumazine synthase
VTVQTGVPISFGVLTCQTIQQARARSVEAAETGRINKGAEAMMAAIHTASTIKRIEGSRNIR